MIFICCVLSFIVYIIFHNIGIKTFFTLSKQSFYDKYSFYECGFKPTTQLLIEFPMQVFVMIAIIILCDVECLFFIIFGMCVEYFDICDMFFFSFFMFFFFIGFYYDFCSDTLVWQYF